MQLCPWEYDGQCGLRQFLCRRPDFRCMCPANVPCIAMATTSAYTARDLDIGRSHVLENDQGRRRPPSLQAQRRSLLSSLRTNPKPSREQSFAYASYEVSLLPEHHYPVRIRTLSLVVHSPAVGCLREFLIIDQDQHRIQTSAHSAGDYRLF